MKKGLFRKGFVLGIIVLFVGAVFIQPLGGTILEKKNNYLLSKGNILYVGGLGPGNYSTIQSAVYDAIDGDTVFVFDNSSPYFEHIAIDKSINLVGENKDTTIIDGGGGDFVKVWADWVNITGFTIRHGWLGLTFSNHTSIIDNTFNSIDYGCGIRTEYCSFINIIDNKIVNNHLEGIAIYHSNNILITGNEIKFNGYDDGGIYLHNSNNNSITNNIISNNRFEGIMLLDSNNNIIVDNEINSNEKGIETESSDNNIIEHNTITSNKYGIYLRSSFNSINANTISYNSDYGIYFRGDCNYNSITENTISNNHIGVCVRFNNNIVKDNTISNNYQQGLYLSGSYNSINNNTVAGNWHVGIEIQGYNNTVERNCISYNREGIGIGNNSNLIKNNIISHNNLSGIWFTKANNNIFQANNIISNSGSGLLIHWKSINNTIIGNNIISNNENGIYIEDSFSNNIIDNNFINNKRNAFFLDCKNTWRENYWNRPRIFPKIIVGEYDIGPKTIPWFNFDWRPALKPNDMEV